MWARTLVLSTALLVASGVELAVVRPFATVQETRRLEKSLESWNRLLPCAGRGNTSTDLFLVYSRSIDGEVAETLARINESFSQRREKWHACFRSVLALSANLSAAEDVYEPARQDENPDWVSGPNAVFRFLMRRFLKGRYSAFFLMEMDSVPRKAGWLAQLEREAVDYPAAAVRGSQYRGDRWNSFMGQLPKAMRLHINGNAIYYPSHPFLSFLSEQIHKEVGTVQNRVPYDVRMAQLVLACEAGASPELARTWTELAPQGRAVYAGDSKLIGNYANTLLNASFDGGEYIYHGSEGNVFSEVGKDKVSLVAVHAGEETMPEFKEALAAPHPFKEVLVLPRGESFCEAARQVDTELFVFVPTARRLLSPVSMLMDGERPLLPFLKSGSPFCGKRCKESLQRAKKSFGVAMDAHFETHDTAFVTELARNFCASGKAAAVPTADDFVAWQMSQKGGVDANYLTVDRGVKGWRSWTVVQQRALMSRRLRELSGDTNSSDTNSSNATCAYGNQAACDADVACTWDAAFVRCKPFFKEDNVTSNATNSSTTTVPPAGPTTTVAPTTEGKTTTLAATTTVVPTTTVTTTAYEAPGSPVITYNIAIQVAEVVRGQRKVFNKLREGCNKRVNDAGVKGKCRGRMKIRKLARMLLRSMPSGNVLILLLKAVGRLDGGAAWRRGRCSVAHMGSKYWKSTPFQARRLRGDFVPEMFGEHEYVSAGALFRALQSSSPIEFQVDTNVTDDADLDGAAPMGTAGFTPTAVNQAMDSIAAENSLAVSGNSPVVSVDEPNDTAEVEMEVVVEDGFDVDTAAIQASLGDTSLMVAAMEEASNTTLGVASTDKCANRDCGGRGTCVDGICQCQAGWSQPNCLLQQNTTTAAAATEMTESDKTALVVVIVALVVTVLLLLLLCLYFYTRPPAVKQVTDAEEQQPPAETQDRTFI